MQQSPRLQRARSQGCGSPWGRANVWSWLTIQVVPNLKTNSRYADRMRSSLVPNICNTAGRWNLNLDTGAVHVHTVTWRFSASSPAHTFWSSAFRSAATQAILTSHTPQLFRCFSDTNYRWHRTPRIDWETGVPFALASLWATKMHRSLHTGTIRYYTRTSNIMEICMLHHDSRQALYVSWS